MLRTAVLAVSAVALAACSPGRAPGSVQTSALDPKAAGTIILDCTSAEPRGYAFYGVMLDLRAKTFCEFQCEDALYIAAMSGTKVSLKVGGDNRPPDEIDLATGAWRRWDRTDGSPWRAHDGHCAIVAQNKYAGFKTFR